MQSLKETQQIEHNQGRMSELVERSENLTQNSGEVDKV